MQPTSPSSDSPTPPTPTPSAAAPTVADPVVEFIRTDRQTAGYILLGIAALILALCGWTIYKATRPAAASTPEPQKKAEEFGLEDLPTATPKDPAHTDYIVGAILSGAGLLVVVAAAVWLLVTIPSSTEAKQRADARALILGVGGLLGAILILAGVWYFYRWSASLGEWLDKDKPKEARWVLFPLLMIVSGAGLMFLSAQPARAEERNNAAMRKLVYGSNMGLAVLLLFVGLIVFNLFISPRLPNKLDVTREGFYSLSSSSKEFLSRLDQPVTAYAILVEGNRATDDIRRLLQNCQDDSKGKFQAKFISPVANKGEYRELARKYPVLEAGDTGVLLTIGEDQKRHTFIRDDEFIQRDQRNPMAPPSPEDRGLSFVGESRLMRELLFLSESEKRAVVYFTQSAGELALEPPPGGEIGPNASATRLKAYLERNYLDVRPLRFDPVSPKIPDDATVVVVAEPTAPLPPAQVEAIRHYMNEPRADKKKGKLIVLAGAQFDPKGKVIRTGLEQLLLEFNVRLGDKVIVSRETEDMDSLTVNVGFTALAVKERNPVAVALGQKTGFQTPLWRPVSAVRDGSPTFKALTLLITAPGRANWLEDSFPGDMRRIFAEFQANPALLRIKEFSENAKPVGVVVSEGDSGRVVVFGSGLIVSDAVGRSSRDTTDPITYELMGATVDWLRDRPTLSSTVEAKKYKSFTLPATADETRGLWFPLLFALMAVTGMGISVWMIRRRAA